MFTSVPCGCRPGWACLDGFVDNMNQIDAHYRLRIDLIYRRGSALYLAEIKPQAGYTALGQALMYATLWEREFPQLRFAEIQILTDTPHPDLSFVAARFNVTVIALAPLPLST